MSYKIVSDSGSNIISMEKCPYASVPLHIIVGEDKFTDDENLNIQAMYDALKKYKGKTSTSCPSPSDWIEAFDGSDNVFCVTITSGLSGSYNSAYTAKHMYEQDYPEKKVYLVDSRSTGPEMALLIDKIHELMQMGMDPEQVYEEVLEYHKHIHLFYALASVDNLAKNGRVNPIVAKGIGLLGVRIMGTTTEEGTLQPTGKARGEKNAIKAMIKGMKQMGYVNKKLIVTHSGNPEGAEALKQAIENEYGLFNGVIQENTGLCSYYAEYGSLLVGFEEG